MLQGENVDDADPRLRARREGAIARGSKVHVNAGGSLSKGRGAACGDSCTAAGRVRSVRRDLLAQWREGAIDRGVQGCCTAEGRWNR